jgi:hypothetical protein
MKSFKLAKIFTILTSGLILTSPLLLNQAVSATTLTQSGAVGVQAVLPGAAPTVGPTIVIPGSNAIFTSTPITVAGSCPTGLTIKVYSNNVFVGSTVCTIGSYTIQVSLFSSTNDLQAKDFDALDQAGPFSNVVKVIFNDTTYAQYVSRMTITSIYAERGATPGSELVWPIVLDGGNAPYALSVDWGDGSPSDLLSTNSPGTVNLKHTYTISGVYKIVIKATDKNGVSAFLQLIGQATGQLTSANNSINAGNIGTTIVYKTVWWPTLLMIPMMFVSFWIGKKKQLEDLHKRVL